MTPPAQSPLSRERFRAILDAYGANPDRWPADERDAALALVHDDRAARALRDHAAQLDVVLATVDDAAPPPADLVGRILAAAPLAASASERRRGLSLARPRRAFGRARRAARYVAAGIPIAAAAAALFWLARAPDETVPAGDTLAALGTYETPGDELLSVSEVGLFETDPWVGCPDSVLGCLEVDVASDEPRSDVTGQTRTQS